MGGVKWTEEQRAAIETHGCNLLVAAGAGSGKTAVLVERIIKMITHPTKPIDIDRLLVVTFTNAAASEMKERIAKAIGEELRKHSKSKQLQRQLTLLNRASITTMHSFCLEVIRNNFHCLDIDPNFRIGDDTETILLKTETLEQMFEEAYEDDNCTIEFLKLVEFYCGNRDDSTIQNLILDLYNFAMSSPYPKQLLNEMAEDFNVDENYKFSDSKWAKILMEDIRIELQGLCNSMKDALKTIRETDGLESYEETFYIEVNMIQDLSSSCKGTWDNLCDEFTKVSFGKLKACKKCQYKDIQERVKDIRNKAKKSISSLKDQIALYGSYDTTLDLIELYPIMRKLSDLVIEFMDRYSFAKRERGIIDFNDFEHFCLNILTEKNENGEINPTKESVRLREKYEEILVDEYQDSNDVQEAIVNAIAKKDGNTGHSNNVFMVGDVKQSIYRFRQARPEIFLEKYNAYGGEKGSEERKITLFKNFRSRREVISAVNFIFKQIMSKNIGELEYDDKEVLNLGADYPSCSDENVITGGNVELHLLEKDINIDEETTKEDIEEVADNIQMEAKMVVKRINELVNATEGKEFKIFDKDLGEYRKVQYKDIVILLRSTANWATVFMEELKENLIPSYADTGSGYFETLEIKTMLSLLQIIDNPRQDIPLIAVMRSPIASFTPEELIDIRIKDKDVEFYEALKKFSIEENNLLGKKCCEFLQKLSMWREKAVHIPIDEFLWYLYTDTGYYAYVGAMAGGIQRQANLRILFERARQYDKTSYKGLFNFINFIDKLRISSGDMGSAKILGENENVVRIMSIHKSKGLEFPIVFLSGLGKGFNMQDLSKKVLFHRELGYGPDFVDIEKRITYQTVLKQSLKKKIKMETLSEEMRILYVAFTRAKEKLIMTGAVKDIKKSIQKWSYAINRNEIKLPEYEVLNAKNYLDWICPAIIRHEDAKEFIKEIDIRENNNFIKDTSKWQVNLYKRQDILLNKKEKDVSEESLNLDEIGKNSKYYDEIKRRLEWEYEYGDISKLPTLITVTELKRMKESELYEDYSQNVYSPKLVKKPLFLEKNKKLTGAEKGTAVHAVMQKLNYNRGLSEEEIKSQIKEMVNKELITFEQGESIDINKIINFFKSNIGKRLIKSNKVYREIPFHMLLNVSDVYKNISKDKYDNESIMLQGIIDCYFEEEDGIVLIDYKTDYIKDGDIESIKQKYKSQLEYYERAIVEITGKKVKEKYLYLFYNDIEVMV